MKAAGHVPLPRDIDMKLICIEEHAIDPAIAHAAQLALRKEAPYMTLQSSAAAASNPQLEDRPHLVEMSDAVALGTDLGAGRIAAMDMHGIDMQVVSYSTPVQLAPEDQAVRLAADANDSLAWAISENPTRLAGFAALPWRSPLAAAEELERAVTELGFKGALIMGRPFNDFLDNGHYAPVLQKLNDLAVPLYVHPFYPVPAVHDAYYAGLKPEVSAQFSLGGWGWHHEAGIHVVRLILAGIFERYPQLQVISGHWGEMVPYFLPRLNDSLPRSITGLSGTIGETYRAHVWVTPSGMYYPAHLDYIRSVVGLERVIWSVDYPYRTLHGTRKFMADVLEDGDERRRISHSNAETLLRL